MQLRNASLQDTDAIVALWQACELTRPWNAPEQDIARKLEHGSPFWLVEIDGKLAACVMFDYDGHRGSVNYLAIAPAHQGQGIGRWLMAQVEAHLLAQGCPKLNLMVRSGNPAEQFYQSLAYQQDPVVVYSKRLITDD